MAFKLKIADLYILLVADGYKLVVGEEAAASTSVIKRWNGSQWVAVVRPANYTGSEFINRPLQRWTGSAWEQVNVV